MGSGAAWSLGGGMLREDYVMRQIRRLVEAFLHATGLPGDAGHEDTLTGIDQALQQLVGLDADTASCVSDESLIELASLGQGKGVTAAGCALAAALLQQAAGVHATQGDQARSYACGLKALNLTLHLRLLDDGLPLPEYAPDVGGLLAALAPYALPAETHLLLCRFYERTEDYARAEDALLDAVDADPDNQARLAMGRAFYGRLLRQTDQALMAGNLPRGEVEDGLAQLRARSEAARDRGGEQVS